MLYMSNENNQDNNDEEKKKTITVRGVDKDIYEKAVLTARETGKTVGEVVNQALTSFLGITSKASRTVDQIIQGAKDTGKSFIMGYEDAKKNITIISDLEELTITKDEIMQSGKKLSFRNIKKLTLDIDQDALNYIDSIIGVDDLIIPSSLNKISVLEKCKFVKKIETK